MIGKSKSFWPEKRANSWFGKTFSGRVEFRADSNRIHVHQAPGTLGPCPAPWPGPPPRANLPALLAPINGTIVAPAAPGLFGNSSNDELICCDFSACDAFSSERERLSRETKSDRNDRNSGPSGTPGLRIGHRVPTKCDFVTFMDFCLPHWTKIHDYHLVSLFCLLISLLISLIIWSVTFKIWEVSCDFIDYLIYSKIYEKFESVTLWLCDFWVSRVFKRHNCWKSKYFKYKTIQ